MNHNQLVARPIASLVKTIETTSAITKIWDKIYAMHSKEVCALIKGGHDLHVEFYEYMLVVKELSDTSVNALTKIIGELEIAKEDGGIDAAGVRLIGRFSEQILGSVKAEHNKHNNIQKNVGHNRMLVAKRKEEIGKSAVAAQIRTVGGGITGGAMTGGVVARVVATGAVIGTGGALAIGFVVGAGFLGICSQLYSLAKKKRFHGLMDLLDKLDVEMKNLEKKSQDFAEETKSLVRHIGEQVKSSELLAECQDDTNRRRVVRTITYTSDQCTLVKDGFRELSAAAQKNIDDLRITVARNAPQALITYIE
ncbi:hypothetical protein EC991_007045 [Linnemannia zychae]|nr:hypothetical protein EC991_007045 [Linnemannia zychae]